jgi:peptide deformylase
VNRQIEESELERIYQLAMDTRRDARHMEDIMNPESTPVTEGIMPDHHPMETDAILHESAKVAEVAKVLKWPHKKLETRCKAVESIDESTIELIATMIKTMHANRGVGLAANQIGEMKRIIVFDLADRMEAPMVLINPVISHRYGEVTMLKEGCLSVPDVQLKTERSLKVRVTALDITGEPVEFEAEDGMAACLQHEIDHLDGIMFFERAASKAAGDIARRKARRKGKVAKRRERKSS